MIHLSADLPPPAENELTAGIYLKRAPHLSNEAYAFDRRLDTCISTDLWMEVILGNLFMVETVTIYTIFKDDWFFSPPKRYSCHTNPGDYEV